MAAEPADLTTDDAAGPYAPIAEPAPAVRKRRRIVGLAIDKPAADPPPAAEPGVPQTTRERRPQTRRTEPKTTPGRRKSLASSFAAIYGGAGSLAERSGDMRMLPTARVLQWNAPVAGEAFDDLISGTIIDKALQPLARKGDKVQKVTNVVGLPMIVYAITNRPELWPVLEPMARQMFYENLAAMGPVIAAKKKRDAQVGKIVTELVEEGMLGRNEDGSMPTPDDLFAMLFAPPPGVTEEP